MSEDYTQIKNYTFEKDIGEGNFGKVKLGIFKPTGEEFAIKVLNKDKIKIKMKNSIFKENQIITKFNHINVIYVFQILEDQENFYIIMEYCKHGELFDYIVKNERLTEEEASIFFYQLINGIEHIHSKGIAHRDLKPENLLLAENNILKIIDFGLSHEFSGEEDELLKTKCGSPSYAAPEIICSPFYDGFKVDVWCSGIILYAMVCGYLPFEGDNNDILFKNILDCEPEFPEFLSDMSIDIIIKILNPDPEKRITIEQIKKHKFYLMGKSLCNIDYDTIENSIIKKRNSIFKNIDEVKKCLNSINKSNDISNSDITPKYNNTINHNIEKPKFDLNKKDEKLSDSNSKNENKNNINKTNNSLELFKRKFMDVFNKYNKKTIDTINQKLKTEVNENNKNSSRPISSKKINIINPNRKIMTTLNNVSDNNKKINPFNFLNFETYNKKFKKDSLFIKILDSTKNNNFLSFYKDYEKLGLIKTKTNKTNLDKIETKSKNKKSINKSKSKKKNKDYNNNNKNIKKIKTTNNNVISLSNDNIGNDANNNNNNKKNQKFNLFKETLKNKNKGKHHFNIMKALSRYDKKENKTAKSPTTPNLTKKNSAHINSNSNSSLRINKNKEINFIVPHSTLYYNNINININELNINPKTSKNKNTPFISSLFENQIKKNNSKNIKSGTTNTKYNFNSLDNKTHKQNKAISAKRLFSHNMKNKTNNNTINTHENIYTINLNNNNNNRNYSINTLHNINIKEKNINSNQKNNSKNNKLLFKTERILSTEPKEMFKFKKQFSFDKRDGSNKEKNKNSKKGKSDKRSKSERVNKSRTINTEIGKSNLYNKKFIKKENENSKYKYNVNKIDELFLYMFMDQKYKKKNNKENNFIKKISQEK